MARIKVETESLDTLIPQYAENKSMLDDYKKLCDNENKKIKELMTDDTYEAGGYKATKSVQVRETMNEDELLDELESLSGKSGGHVYDSIKDFRKQLYTYLKENKVIKTKKYVDFDALESALYKLKNQDIENDNGYIGSDYLVGILDKCRETKEVVTLRISKVKENK